MREAEAKKIKAQQKAKAKVAAAAMRRAKLVEKTNNMTKLMTQVWNKLDIPAGTKVLAEHVARLPGTLCMAVAHIQ